MHFTFSGQKKRKDEMRSDFFMDTGWLIAGYRTCRRSFVDLQKNLAVRETHILCQDTQLLRSVHVHEVLLMLLESCRGFLFESYNSATGI